MGRNAKEIKHFNAKWSQGYKTFFHVNSAEHEIYHAKNVKMPTFLE